ncbi:MAG: T9SS type A sorting domain-containing protein, partial [Candidatus Marinimicrobia bacterium]|nr:T9SS type A sorting domain-containing protein [Candidatus Neomarinimicrobiota bacterium]
MKKLLFCCLNGWMILFFPRGLWSQSSAIPWSSFSGGFGAASSTNTTVQSSTGEIAGTSEGGNTIVKSGFLVVRLQPGSINAIDVTESLPTTYALRQNYPNPFNPSTTLRFALPQATEVRLVVYDLQGREVARLLNQRVEHGYHQVTWNGRD